MFHYSLRHWFTFPYIEPGNGINRGCGHSSFFFFKELLDCLPNNYSNLHSARGTQWVLCYWVMPLTFSITSPSNFVVYGFSLKSSYFCIWYNRSPMHCFSINQKLDIQCFPNIAYWRHWPFLRMCIGLLANQVGIILFLSSVLCWHDDLITVTL